MSADDPWRGCNPLDPAFRDDPYPSLRRLREVEPVNLTPIGFWRLTRYADVNRLLHEVPAGTRTTDGVLPGVDESLSGQRQFMLQQDPPTHTRLRRLVSRAFTPRAIAALRGNVQRIVDECLDRVAARGTMDVIADLALPANSTDGDDLFLLRRTSYIGSPDQTQNELADRSAFVHGAENLRFALEVVGVELLDIETGALDVLRDVPGEVTPACEPRPVALSADVAWAKRTVDSGSNPWQRPTAKPALKASPQPQVHLTFTSKAGTWKCLPSAS